MKKLILVLAAAALRSGMGIAYKYGFTQGADRNGIILINSIFWIVCGGFYALFREKTALRPERKVLRYAVFVIFIAALVGGVSSVAGILAPYSSFGRIASNLFAPVYAWGNNLLAYLSERVGSYAFYPREVWIKSIGTFVVAVVTVVVLAVLA